ncbi:MAG: fructose-bisphosphate aldolase class I [Chloroflexi bacterium]|nr:fructose-bisphosphate aldolase class I [Chloroflexota bacterium]
MPAPVRRELEGTIGRLLAPGKGLLAADESFSTIGRRFEQVGIASTEASRRAFRELLFTAPGIGDQISGVILFDETIRQRASDGTPFPRLLEERGSVPGIKVDLGAKPLALAPGESVTEGLDGLRERLAEYRELGARFTKWRAVLVVGPGLPSDNCVSVNAHALARFAALSQEAGLVPIVEPEVLAEGDHSLEQSYEATLRAQRLVFAELVAQRVSLEHMLLKPNMVMAGLQHPRRASVEEVATATVRTLRSTVPPAVPGVVFLSGGQTPTEATAHLAAMNAAGPHPWVLSFSFSRAIQDPVLETWRGDETKVAEAQAVFAEHARLTGLARRGPAGRDVS